MKSKQCTLDFSFFSISENPVKLKLFFRRVQTKARLFADSYSSQSQIWSEIGINWVYAIHASSPTTVGPRAARDRTRGLIRGRHVLCRWVLSPYAKAGPASAPLFCSCSFRISLVWICVFQNDDALGSEWDSAGVKALASHAADPRLSPATAHGPLSPRVEQEYTLSIARCGKRVNFSDNCAQSLYDT